MQKIKCSAVVAILLCTSNARSNEIYSQPGYGFAPTVKELLEMDAKKARAAAHGQTVQEEQPPKPIIPQEIKPIVQLIGIYGYSAFWKAEVLIGSATYTFSPGSIHSGFKARRITAQCIDLAHRTFSQKLCTQ